MVAKVLQEKLAKGLASVLRIVSAKPTIPILSNILLEAEKGKLRITATDLNMGVKVWVGSKVEKEGSITVPAKVFADLIQSFSPSNIQLVSEGASLKISGDGNQARLAGIEASEFPSLGKVTVKKGAEIDVSSFRKAVDRVVLAASTDETRPVLSGVLFNLSDNSLRMVATDGYRLSLAYLEDEGGEKKKEWVGEIKKIIGDGMIVPARALREVERLADEQKASQLLLSLAKDQNLAVFTIGEAEFTTRLIEGNFPNFTQVIPKEEMGVATIEIEALAKAVKTAAIFARDSANIIHWKIESDELTISANSPSYGESESKFEISLKGEGGQIAFNSRYLLEFLQVVPAKRINFSMKGSLDPGVFRPVGKQKEEFLHLIMPVRVQK